MYFAVVTVFALALGICDIYTNSSAKQNEFQSVRDANQGALLEMLDGYDDGKTLTTPEMMNEWLLKFASDEDLEYGDIVLNFVQTETDPPLYLVYIEGHAGEYRMISRDAYVKYVSGATIIE